MIFNLFVDPHLGMGHFFSLFVFADHILATCHILNGHKESTSLFGAAKGKVAKKATVGKQDRKGGRKGNCRRSVEEKGGCSRDHWEGKSKKDKGDTEKNEKRRERIAVRFLVPLAGESYFEVRLLYILRQLLMVCFSTLFLLILG